VGGYSLRMTYDSVQCKPPGARSKNKRPGNDAPGLCQTSGELDHLDHPELEFG
jgi:hypothetical protein